jgi:thioredoxin reductase (NADPH)
MENLIIIGSGPAGLTAAIYAARANLKPLLIAGTLPGGLLTQTSDIENYPGFEEPMNGFDLMFRFQKQAEKFGAKIINETVVNAKLKSGELHELTLGSGEKLQAQAIIIATGASPRWLGLENEERLKTKGVSACATCDGAFFRDVPVAVIGGGDTAMEEAIFLTRFASEVIVIHRRDQLRASKIMADRALNNPKIKFLWNTVVEDLEGENELDGLVVKNLKTGGISKFACNGYFAALGHIPNTSIFKNIDMDKTGYIKVIGNSSYTNIDGVFAAGDCADKVYRQAITAAGMGCKAAIDAERWLEANKSE